MKSLKAKFQSKDFVQNLLVEITGDVLMIALSLIAGYYIKLFIIG